MVTGVSSERLRLLPSMESRKLWLRLLTFILTVQSSLSSTGRMFRLWGATAVMAMLLEVGAIIGPPLLRE